MNSHRLLYPVLIMARVLSVSRSGFYAWVSRPTSSRSLRHSNLKIHIVTAHRESRATYGVLRLQSVLADQGVVAGRDQISMLRKELGLRCVQKRPFRVTTDSDHALAVAPNLLMQDFRTQEPGQVWGTDITYIRTMEGWLYLAGVKDFHTREIVGYALASQMSVELVRQALRAAVAYRKPELGCIIHSDRGSQYCARKYQSDLRSLGLQVSMSRRGNCYDNAPTESFWGTLKQELVHQRLFTTRKQAEASIREFIEIFYNRIRKHSSIGNIPPAIYAKNFTKERRSA